MPSKKQKVQQSSQDGMSDGSDSEWSDDSNPSDDKKKCASKKSNADSLEQKYHWLLEGAFIIAAPGSNKAHTEFATVKKKPWIETDDDDDTIDKNDHGEDRKMRGVASTHWCVEVQWQSNGEIEVIECDDCSPWIGQRNRRSCRRKRDKETETDEIKETNTNEKRLRSEARSNSKSTATLRYTRSKDSRMQSLRTHDSKDSNDKSICTNSPSSDKKGRSKQRGVSSTVTADKSISRTRRERLNDAIPVVSPPAAGPKPRTRLSSTAESKGSPKQTNSIPTHIDRVETRNTTSSVKPTRLTKSVSNVSRVIDVDIAPVTRNKKYSAGGAFQWSSLPTIIKNDRNRSLNQREETIENHTQAAVLRQLSDEILKVLNKTGNSSSIESDRKRLAISIQNSMNYLQSVLSQLQDVDTGRVPSVSNRKQNAQASSFGDEKHTSEDAADTSDLYVSSLKDDEQRNQFKLAMEDFSNRPDVRPCELSEALQMAGPPFGLQRVQLEISKIHMQRKWKEEGVFKPYVGMKVNRMFHGKWYEGEVISGPNMRTDDNDRECETWKVLYSDQDTEEADIYDLYPMWLGKNTVPHPTSGRVLQAFELFSGKGIVTQKFIGKNWRVLSIDNDPHSNATIKQDIMVLDPKKFAFVPDFIWASPPCQTYSCMTGGRHRNPKHGEYEKSDAALQHNRFFVKMTDILRWAYKKHPHLLIVIENPVGHMKDMPLMKQCIREFHLKEILVHYCAFGRNVMKPTNLWTNSRELSERLSTFKCRCERGSHEGSVRRECHALDHSSIPEPLADYVANYVDARFTIDKIQHEQAADPWDAE